MALRSLKILIDIIFSRYYLRLTYFRILTFKQVIIPQFLKAVQTLKENYSFSCYSQSQCNDCLPKGGRHVSPVKWDDGMRRIVACSEMWWEMLLYNGVHYGGVVRYDVILMPLDCLTCIVWYSTVTTVRGEEILQYTWRIDKWINFLK